MVGDNFKWIILEECSSYSELYERELFYIRKYRTYIDYDDCNGYNMTLNNSGTSDIIRDKLSKRFRGKNNPRYGDHRSFEELYGGLKNLIK